MNLKDLLKDKRTFAPADDPGSPPADPPAEPEAPDFSWLPEDYRKDDTPDLEGFRAHYDEIVSERAMQQEALAEVPEKSDGYEIKLPDDIEYGELDLPEDFKVELQADDPAMAPLFQGLQGLLHELKAPAGTMQKALGLLAQYEAIKFSAGYSAANADMASLGATSQSRVENVERKIRNQLPADLAEGLMAATGTAAGVKALEKILMPKSLKSPNPTPPVADIEKMTPYQRLQHANNQSAKAG